MTADRTVSGISSPASLQLAVEQIEHVVAELGTLPGSLRALRSLAEANPLAFFKAAVKLFASHLDAAAYRAMAEILVRQESLFDYLLDARQCSLHNAVQVFRQLLAVDPTLDFRLARMLPPRNETAVPDKRFTGAPAARALEILDQTSPGQRLLSVVGHLPASADRQLSARAALFVGRRLNNPAWVEKQLNREDPRVRANALESVWGLKSSDAVRIMEECVDDSNNRVAGNALVGLHLAGSPDVIMKTILMSMESDPARRSAAAWVMGKIGDPEFVESLKSLMRDPSPQVRSTAVRSLGQISRAETKRLEAQAEQERLLAQQAAEQAAASHHAPHHEEHGAPEPLNLPVPNFELRLDGTHRGKK